jgi:hypothetical protein
MMDWSEGGVGTICAPRDQRKSKDNQREQAYPVPGATSPTASLLAAQLRHAGYLEGRSRAFVESDQFAFLAERWQQRPNQQRQGQ